MTLIDWPLFLIPWAVWAGSMLALRILPVNEALFVQGFRAIVWGLFWGGLLLGLTEMTWAMGWWHTETYAVWRKVPGRVPLLVGLFWGLWRWRMPR